MTAGPGRGLPTRTAARGAARSIARDVRRADRAANARYPKSRLVLGWLRRCQRRRASQTAGGRLLYRLDAAAYKLVTEGMLGIEIPPSTTIGPGLRLRHGIGTVVNPGTRIGRGVMLRHHVTLGNRKSPWDCPVIEDDVEIGVGAVVVGAITVGRGARIGPYAVVVADVPAGAVVRSPRPEIVVPDEREEVTA